MYSIEMIDSIFEKLSKHYVAEDVVIPAPSYMSGPNWTDEHREKNGYQKQPDGSWGMTVNSKQLFDNCKKDVIKMFQDNRKMSQQINTLRKKVYELEYACRVAAKAISKIQNIKEENE
jgi:hypothetical protein